MCSNDLVKIRTRQFSQQVEKDQFDIGTTDGIDKAYYERIQVGGVVLPLPRRDHSSCLMKNGTLLLVYGGRNDNDESGEFRELADLMVYDIGLN